MYALIGILVLVFAGMMVIYGLAGGAGSFPIAVVGGIIIAAIVSSTSDSIKDQKEGIIRLNTKADWKKKVEMETAILAKHGYKETAAYQAEIARLRKRYVYGPRQK